MAVLLVALKLWVLKPHEFRALKPLGLLKGKVLIVGAIYFFCAIKCGIARDGSLLENRDINSTIAIMGILIFVLDLTLFFFSLKWNSAILERFNTLKLSTKSSQYSVHSNFQIFSRLSSVGYFAWISTVILLQYVDKDSDWKGKWADDTLPRLGYFLVLVTVMCMTVDFNNGHQAGMTSEGSLNDIDAHTHTNTRTNTDTNTVMNPLLNPLIVPLTQDCVRKREEEEGKEGERTRGEGEGRERQWGGWFREGEEGKERARGEGEGQELVHVHSFSANEQGI